MIPLAMPRLDGALEKVTECVKSGWISSQAETVREFEAEFARWIGAGHAVSCSSGTAALHLALTALRVSGGHEVLVPSFTFIATANAVTYAGARPVFCDSAEDTWCIDVDDASNRMTWKTRAIVPVHINGYMANMDRVRELALDRGLKVVEDACQALGSEWKGRKAGTLGDIGCFSFFVNKQLTTGEGGMCITDSEALAKAMRTLRDHGRTSYRFYIHDVIGFNYRMTALQAAVGLAQLERLTHEVARRKVLNELWRDVLGSTQPPNKEQSPWLYHYKLGAGDELAVLDRLRSIGVESRPFYLPCHLQRPYRGGSILPVAEKLHGVMLPLHEGVTGEHISMVKEALAQAAAVR